MKSLTISQDMSPTTLLESYRSLNNGLDKPKPESVIIELFMTMLENLPESTFLYKDFTNTPEYTNGDWDPVPDWHTLERLVSFLQKRYEKQFQGKRGFFHPKYVPNVAPILDDSNDSDPAIAPLNTSNQPPPPVHPEILDMLKGLIKSLGDVQKEVVAHRTTTQQRQDQMQLSIDKLHPAMPERQASYETGNYNGGQQQRSALAQTSKPAPLSGSPQRHVNFQTPQQQPRQQLHQNQQQQSHQQQSQQQQQQQSPQSQRPMAPRQKSKLPCRKFLAGHCPFGPDCLYSHPTTRVAPLSSTDPFTMDHFDACAGPQYLDFGRINSPCKVCAQYIENSLDDNQLAARFAMIELQDKTFNEEVISYHPDQVEDVRSDTEHFEQTRQKGDDVHAYTLACLVQQKIAPEVSS